MPSLLPFGAGASIAQGLVDGNPCPGSLERLVKILKTRFSVISAKVPGQARDPELVERAGIQEYLAVLYPGLRRGDGLE
jgi:hypothetical protein